MKFCVDCIHFIREMPNGSRAYCCKTTGKMACESNYDPVWGTPIYYDCLTLRLHEDSCGIQGKWFKPHMPIPGIKPCWKPLDKPEVKADSSGVKEKKD